MTLRLEAVIWESVESLAWPGHATWDRVARPAGKAKTLETAKANASRLMQDETIELVRVLDDDVEVDVVMRIGGIRGPRPLD